MMEGRAAREKRVERQEREVPEEREGMFDRRGCLGTAETRRRTLVGRWHFRNCIEIASLTPTTLAIWLMNFEVVVKSEVNFPTRLAIILDKVLVKMPIFFLMLANVSDGTATLTFLPRRDMKHRTKDTYLTTPLGENQPCPLAAPAIATGAA